MEPKHRHCYFKRSASSCLVTPMHLHSSRISSSHSQSAGGIKPALASLDPPKTPNSIEKTKKSGGFLSFCLANETGGRGIRVRQMETISHWRIMMSGSLYVSIASIIAFTTAIIATMVTKISTMTATTEWCAHFREEASRN